MSHPRMASCPDLKCRAIDNDTNKQYTLIFSSAWGESISGPWITRSEQREDGLIRSLQELRIQAGSTIAVHECPA
ncbi:hypothetical protein ACFLZR_02290 [Candidatus Neomarinimicrobiota bacterium]